MLSSFYRVEIERIALAAPNDGFVDNRTVESYLVDDPSPDGFDVDAAIGKERANLRYDAIVASLGMMANCYVTNMEAVDGGAADEPTSFNFTLQVERGDSVLVTEDETSPGTYLTGTAAIRRCVARALTQSRTNVMGDYYDPTGTPAPGNVVAYPRTGSRLTLINVGSLGSLTVTEGLVTVAKITTV